MWIGEIHLFFYVLVKNCKVLFFYLLQFCVSVSEFNPLLFSIQEEVTDMINKKYIEFIPSMEGAEELLDQVESVSKDIDLLKSCIENEVLFFHY